jgi:hypothetical protein
MAPIRIFALQFLLSLTAYALIGAWLAAPWLARRPRDPALMLLIAPQTLRHIGVTLLVPGVAAPSLPAEFARQTAAGDLVTSILALACLVALRLRWRARIALVWVFNVVGCADLLLNMAHGARLRVANHLESAWIAPTFVVPGMLVLHVLVFWMLLRRAESDS